MSLSLEDYKYFDAKFRETDSKFGPLHEKINEVKNTLVDHIAKPCSDTAMHIAECHDPVKFWGTVAAIVATMSGLAAGIIWLIQHA
jgi:hypothetical protein